MSSCKAPNQSIDQSIDHSINQSIDLCTGDGVGGLWSHGAQGLHGRCSNHSGRSESVEHGDWLVQTVCQLLTGRRGDGGRGRSRAAELRLIARKCFLL